MRRLLVDWDYAAKGLWLVGSERDRPELNLSDGLQEALEAWNLACEQGDRTKLSPLERERLADEGRRLAAAVQGELGASWEVLYAYGGAWHWVEAPAAWS